MGGDGMQGLAIAIFAAMMLMLLAGFVLAFVLGQFLGRAFNLSGAQRWILSLALGLLGLGAATLLSLGAMAHRV
jgi:hypothetical protein